MMKTVISNNPKQQAGTILAVSLIILLVLTIIGVSSLSTSSLQEKISGNFRDREIAFQAAEAALAEAEVYVANNINNVAGVFIGTTASKSTPFYAKGEGPTSKTALTAGWWATPGTTCRAATKPAEVKTAACYTVETRGQFGAPPPATPNRPNTPLVKGRKGPNAPNNATQADGFRITVRATGMSDNTWVILQSHFSKVFIAP